MKPFYPTWLVYNVLDITPRQLQDKNIKGILLDVDNTLVSWEDDFVTSQVCDWVKSMQECGIAIVLISNNRKNRVEKIANVLKLPFVFSAKKPFQTGFKKGIALLGLRTEDIVVIGDQLFTDVLGATLMNMKSVLVKSITASDMLPTKIVRYVEKIALKRMKQKYHVEWRETIEK